MKRAVLLKDVPVLSLVLTERRFKIMKRILILILLFALAMVLGFYVQAQATLTIIGQAHYGGQNYNLIWEKDSPFGSIVWLDYTSYYNWANQVAWASSLNTPGTLTYTIDPLYSLTWRGDWRLPATVDGYPDYGFDGTTKGGYNITSSEMGYLFYTELGNRGDRDICGNSQPGYGLKNMGPFQHLVGDVYWSGTENFYLRLFGLDYAWILNFNDGEQWVTSKGDTLYALAVRPADVSVVPIPGAVWLLGSGIAGLLGLRRNFKN